MPGGEKKKNQQKWEQSRLHRIELSLPGTKRILLHTATCLQCIIDCTSQLARHQARKKQNKTKTPHTHTQKNPHHKNTCFITSVFLYLWLMNLKLCVLISKCTLPRVNQPRVKRRRKTPQITERTEKLHTYCTLQKEEQFQLAFSLVLPPRKPVFEQIWTITQPIVTTICEPGEYPASFYRSEQRQTEVRAVSVCSAEPSHCFSANSAHWLRRCGRKGSRVGFKRFPSVHSANHYQKFI